MAEQPEPGRDMSVPDYYTCPMCGVEVALTYKSNHDNWHTYADAMQSPRIAQLENRLENQIRVLQEVLMNIESVIGTRDNYNFVEKSKV